jgi:hypothetical protein
VRNWPSFPCLILGVVEIPLKNKKKKLQFTGIKTKVALLMDPTMEHEDLT